MKMISIGKDVEKLESLFIADSNVKLSSYYGNQLGGCSEKLMMELSSVQFSSVQSLSHVRLFATP